MVASVPEETKRIFSIQGARSRTSSASWISRGDGAPKLEPLRSCSSTSRITSTLACPRMAGPQLPT